MYLKQAIKDRCDYLTKQAAQERIGDWAYNQIGTNLSNAILPVGGVANPVGSVMGLMEGDAKKALKERGNPALSLIPGVGPYRQGVVARAVADESGPRGRKQLLHEILGQLGGTLAGGVAGAGAGALIGGLADGEEGAGVGALVGGGVGLLSPVLAAALLAAVKRTRTPKEQSKHDKESNLAANYLPGVGLYNYYKRLGSGYDRYFEGKEKINKNAAERSLRISGILRKLAEAPATGQPGLAPRVKGLTPQEEAARKAQNRKIIQQRTAKAQAEADARAKQQQLGAGTTAGSPGVKRALMD